MSLVFETQFEKGSLIDKMSNNTISFNSYMNFKNGIKPSSSIVFCKSLSKATFTSTKLTQGVPMTYVCNVNFTKNNFNGAYLNLFAIGEPIASPTNAFGIYLLGTTSFNRVGVFLFNDPNGRCWFYCNSTVSILTPISVCVTFNGGLTVSSWNIYVNGIKQTIINTTDNLTVFPPLSTSYKFGVFDGAGITQAIFYKHKIYNHILSTKEINQEYQRFLSSSTYSLPKNHFTR